MLLQPPKHLSMLQVRPLLPLCATASTPPPFPQATAAAALPQKRQEQSEQLGHLCGVILLAAWLFVVRWGIKGEGGVQPPPPPPQNGPPQIGCRHFHPEEMRSENLS